MLLRDYLGEAMHTTTTHDAYVGIPLAELSAKARGDVLDEGVVRSRAALKPLIKRVMKGLEPKNVDNFRLKATNYVANHLRLKKETKVMADARRKKMAASKVDKYHNGGGKEHEQAWYHETLNGECTSYRAMVMSTMSKSVRSRLAI